MTESHNSQESKAKTVYLYKNESELENTDTKFYVLQICESPDSFFGMLATSSKTDPRMSNYYKTMVNRIAFIINLFNTGRPDKYEIVMEFYKIEFFYCQCVFKLVTAMMHHSLSDNDSLVIITPKDPAYREIALKSDYVLYRKDKSFLVYKEYEFAIMVSRNLADLTFLYVEVSRLFAKLQAKILRISTKIEFFLKTKKRLTHNLILEFNKDGFLIEQSCEYFDMLEQYFILPFTIAYETNVTDVSLHDLIKDDSLRKTILDLKKKALSKSSGGRANYSTKFKDLICGLVPKVHCTQSEIKRGFYLVVYNPLTFSINYSLAKDQMANKSKKSDDCYSLEIPADSNVMATLKICIRYLREQFGVSSQRIMEMIRTNFNYSQINVSSTIMKETALGQYFEVQGMQSKPVKFRSARSISAQEGRNPDRVGTAPRQMNRNYQASRLEVSHHGDANESNKSELSAPERRTGRRVSILDQLHTSEPNLVPQLTGTPKSKVSKGHDFGLTPTGVTYNVNGEPLRKFKPDNYWV